jgi:multidrug resistance efflux pump
VRKSFAALTRGEHLGGKIFAAFCGLLVLLSFVITLDYRVEGVATLSTDQVRYVSAPFDGVISDVFVREGDAVRKGDGLAKLDTRELQLKKSQESADIVRYTREAEKSRAANALADMKIAQSRMEEVVCELKRTDYAIEQATITAQSDGVIVEGDSKKLLGSPVAKGDVLMKVARIEGIYILIKINERDLDQIRQGMQGEMMLVSQPDNTFPIVVDKVIPMAEVDQREGNVFVLKAHVNGAVRSWWRPGMSGVAKIDAGKRSIAWLLSHRIIDYLRMKLWW